MCLLPAVTGTLAIEKQLIRKAIRKKGYKIVFEWLENQTSRNPNTLTQERIEKYLPFFSENLEYFQRMLQLLEKYEIVLIERVANTLFDIVKRIGCEAKRVQIDCSYVYFSSDSI